MFLCSSSFYNAEYTETQGVNWNFKNSITSELSHSCSFHSAALLTTPRRARPRSLGSCLLCVCPVWDVVFLRIAAVEQINSGCCLQRCDQGYRQPTFCFTRVHFQQPDSRLLTKSAPSTGQNFSQMCSSAAKCGTQRWMSSIQDLKQKNLRCCCSDLFKILNNETVILLHIRFFFV